MDGRMFDGLISGLLIIGAVIGVALCGIVWALVRVLSHVSIHWIA